MEGSIIDLSKYRMRNALDDYETAAIRSFHIIENHLEKLQRICYYLVER